MKKEEESRKTNPIDSQNKVEQSNDEHIDQDFKGYPHHPAKENIINPKSKEDRLSAAIDVENNPKPKKPKQSKEDAIVSNGSAGAFNATEMLDNDIDSEPKTDDNKPSY